MRDHWLDEHVGDEAVVRPAFETSLSETLQAELRNGRRPAGPSRRTQVLIWVAASVVLLAGGAAIWAQSGTSHVISTTDDVTIPTTAVAVTATSVVADTSVESTSRVTPTSSINSTTSAPATTAAPVLVATSPEQQTVLDYLSALSEQRYADAAKLLSEGGLSLEERGDLRPFLNADARIPNLAASLRTWCETALCDVPTALRSVESWVVATFSVDGVERSSAFVAGTFEGSPLVYGLPLQLPAGASLAETAECTNEPVDHSAYADLDGDGWYEIVTLVKSPDRGLSVTTCGTTLQVPTLDLPLSEANAVGTPRVFPVDIEDDGRDELVVAVFQSDGTSDMLQGEVVVLTGSGLATTGQSVSLSSSGHTSFGCTDLDDNGTRDLVTYTYSFVGGSDISNSTALNFTASIGDVTTTGSLALPAQQEEAFRLIAGYCGNFPTQTG